MKTKAAVVYEVGKPIEIEELELDGPKDGEVLIRYTHAGLCHSDIHVSHGDLEARLPMVLGHEGAGVVEEVGPGVTRVKPGDRVVARSSRTAAPAATARPDASRSATGAPRSWRATCPASASPSRGLVDAEVVGNAFNAVGKGGRVVITGLNKLMAPTIQLPGTILTLFRKSVIGSLFGDCNPTTDIPKILGLYQAGDIKLDEIITRTYRLDEVNEGYDDLMNGKNVRGVIVHEH